MGWCNGKVVQSYSGVSEQEMCEVLNINLRRCNTVALAFTDVRATRSSVSAPVISTFLHPTLGGRIIRLTLDSNLFSVSSELLRM